MKFGISTLTVLYLASAVLANHISVINGLLNKREIHVYNDAAETLNENNPFGSTLNDDCTKDLEPYKDCLIIPSIDTHKKDCETITSERCKNFLSNPKSVIPNCEVEIEGETIEDSFKYIMILYDIICIRDDKGNICPMSQRLLYEYTDPNPLPMTEEKSNQLMNATCQSEKCRKSSYDAINSLMNYDIIGQLELDPYEIYSMKELTNALNSKECLSQSSSATSQKIVNGLLVTMILFLYYLL
ncbi:hypothetical protein PIROE2DRAFT_16735 [Piromyces sp. E2]|nr:hypothetical protein PIROE2DRAFT_16735 [Piromyces sp. E2]|eukprot:OUM58088.1 hypothetical protein PIROE2DRAFT_16735 [Piromyces sp. E2]